MAARWESGWAAPAATPQPSEDEHGARQEEDRLLLLGAEQKTSGRGGLLPCELDCFLQPWAGRAPAAGTSTCWAALSQGQGGMKGFGSPGCPVGTRTEDDVCPPCLGAFPVWTQILLLL